MLKLTLLLLLGAAFVRSYEDMTVYQYLVSHNYTMFVQLLREAGQSSSLNGQGPFTVLAPSNAAILNMDPDLASLLAHNDLQKRQLVKYHILKGYILSPQLHHGGYLASVEGQSVSVDRDQTGKVLLNNVSHIVSNSDVICKNGVIQTIDTVLEPPVFGHNNLMQELIIKDKLFNEFTMAIILTNLTELMKNSEMTVFAPSDIAFGKHYQSILHPSIHIPNRDEVFYEMLKYHMVPGARTASMLRNGEQLYTIHGTPLNITIDTKGSMVLNSYARITDPDLPATNGIIHAIDDLLFPRDLFEKLREIYNQHHNNFTQTAG